MVDCRQINKGIFVWRYGGKKKGGVIMWYKLLPQTESLVGGMVNRQIVIDLRKCYSINLLGNCIEFRMDGGDMFTDDYETHEVAEEEYNDLLAKLGAV